MRAPFVPGLVLGLALMSSGGFAVVAAQETAPKAGLELFSVMVPAYRSPRCINCHGMVNPETGANHPGGVVPGFKKGGDASQTGPQLCVACHTENTTGPAPAVDDTQPTPEEQNYEMGLGPQPPPDKRFITTHVPAHPKTGPWRLAPPAMSFVDKSDRELCRQTRILTRGSTDDANALDANGLLAHLTGDTRIEEAFEGHIGMDATSPEYDPVAEPPDMPQSDFEAAAVNWVTAGASCSGPGWHGTLTYEQTQHSSLNQPAPGMTHTLDQTASTTQVWYVEPKTNPDDGLTADWTGRVTGNTTETTVISGTTSCSGRLQVPYTQTTTLTTTTSGQGSAIVDVLVQDIGNGTFYIQSMPSAGVQQGQMVGTTHTEQSGGCAPIPPTNDTQTHPYPIINDAVSTQAQAKTDENGNPVLQGGQTQRSPDGSVTVTITWNLTNP